MKRNNEFRIASLKDTRPLLPGMRGYEKAPLRYVTTFMQKPFVIQKEKQNDDSL